MTIAEEMKIKALADAALWYKSTPTAEIVEWCKDEGIDLAGTEDRLMGIARFLTDTEIHQILGGGVVYRARHDPLFSRQTALGSCFDVRANWGENTDHGNDDGKPVKMTFELLFTAVNTSTETIIYRFKRIA